MEVFRVTHKFKKSTRIWKQGYFVNNGFRVPGILMACGRVAYGKMPYHWASKLWSKVTCKNCLRKQGNNP